MSSMLPCVVPWLADNLTSDRSLQTETCFLCFRGPCKQNCHMLVLRQSLPLLSCQRCFLLGKTSFFLELSSTLYPTVLDCTAWQGLCCMLSAAMLVAVTTFMSGRHVKATKMSATGFICCCSSGKGLLALSSCKHCLGKIMMQSAICAGILSNPCFCLVQRSLCSTGMQLLADSAAGMLRLP